MIEPNSKEEVILLCPEPVNELTRNVAKLAVFAGAAVRIVADPASIPGGSCVIAHAGALVVLNPDINRWAKLLVYGFSPSGEHNDLVRKLTDGVFDGVMPVADGEAFTVSPESRELTAQFAGLTFGQSRQGQDCAFIGPHVSTEVPIRIGQRPFFVQQQSDGCHLFLLAGRAIADLDALVDPEKSILDYFSTVAPLMMFLRHALGKTVWHNDDPRACLIIDDPLLRNRYGFLDYRELSEVMKKHRFTTSIAFIPWNYRRSRRDVVDLFAGGNGYSLCIHGCDHTAGEFGISNRAALQERARTALTKMERHRERWGLAFDPVMVFPQGIFSTAAVEALKNCGYLAAVNSSPHPVDLESEAFKLREILDVAITRFSDFPLFVRRYPHNVAEIAFDLFLGKPALLVEHHGYFRDGYTQVEAFIDRINNLEPRLQWTSLAEICSGACLQRTSPAGAIEVRFYTDYFRLRNETAEPRTFNVWRAGNQSEPGTALMLDGRCVQPEGGAPGVAANVFVAPGHTVSVRIERNQSDKCDNPIKRNLLEMARVFLRRRVCEFRDNHLQTSRVARIAAKILPPLSSLVEM